MRLLTHITAVITILFALISTSCEQNNDTPRNSIIIREQINCSFYRQILEVEYKLTGFSDKESYPEVTATTDADWILNINCSNSGIIAIDIDENDGDMRSTTITVCAPNHAKTTLTITQLGASTDSSHTLMFYFFGTSLSRFFDDNIADAKTAVSTGILGKNNRIIFFRQRGKNSAYIGELCYDPISKSAIECVIRDNISIDGAYITPELIAKHIQMMEAVAPANRYGLVLAGHGHGWLTRQALNEGDGPSLFGYGGNIWQPALGAETTRAFGEYNVQVDITELADGLELSGIDIDYILFDACFMSNIEAVYELRDCANYIIASPCEIMGRGFPYHRTLPYLFASGGSSSDLKGAAESYYKFYRDEYTSNARCGSVALYDCTELEALAKVTKDVVATAKTSYDSDNLQTYEGQSKHIFYDFGQWANVVATDNAALKLFNDQLERTVIAKYTLPSFYSAYGVYGTYPINEEVYSGVTTSAPSEAYPIQWKTTNWYKRVWE